MTTEDFASLVNRKRAEREADARHEVQRERDEKVRRGTRRGREAEVFAQLVEEVAATLRRSSVKTTMTKVQRLPGYGVGHDRSGEFHLGRRSLETKKFDGWTIPVHKGFQLWVSRDGTEWTDGYKKPKWRDYRRCGDPDPVVAYLQVDSSHRANRNLYRAFPLSTLPENVSLLGDGQLRCQYREYVGDSTRVIDIDYRDALASGIASL